MKAALARGEDVSGKEEALIWAVKKWHNPIVQILLQQPTIDVNFDPDGAGSALHTAAALGNPEAVHLLLADQRVNVNSTAPRHGWTPLHFAACLNHS